MIAWIEGRIVEKNPPVLVIATHGVGYAIETSTHTFFQLPEENQTATLYIHTIIREDAHLLFGFYDKAEREMFQLLIKINGIGPKLALAILSGMSYHELIQCIALKNMTALGKISGIGKKTAERLVLEMQDKITQLLHAPAVSKTAINYNINPAIQEATSALLALGYKAGQIQLAMEAISADDKATQNSEYCIREALKYFNRAG